jgi:hypothetical protein
MCFMSFVCVAIILGNLLCDMACVQHVSHVKPKVIVNEQQQANSLLLCEKSWDVILVQQEFWFVQNLLKYISITKGEELKTKCLVDSDTLRCVWVFSFTKKTLCWILYLDMIQQCQL